jgi:hypothetical protein
VESEGADEAVMNIVHKRKKSPLIIFPISRTKSQDAINASIHDCVYNLLN